jgi:hypothetical protein
MQTSLQPKVERAGQGSAYIPIKICEATNRAKVEAKRNKHHNCNKRSRLDVFRIFGQQRQPKQLHCFYDHGHEEEEAKGQGHSQSECEVRIASGGRLSRGSPQ